MKLDISSPSSTRTVQLDVFFCAEVSLENTSPSISASRYLQSPSIQTSAITKLPRDEIGNSAFLTSYFTPTAACACNDYLARRQLKIQGLLLEFLGNGRFNDEVPPFIQERIVGGIS